MIRTAAFAALVAVCSARVIGTRNQPIYASQQYPDPEPCLGNCSWIHDPNIVVKDKTYYRFSTSGNIAIATAPALKGPWDYQGELLEQGTSIHVTDGQDIWAPNINQVGSTYYAFYSVSTMGSQQSQIGLATSDSLDPGSWTDHGSMNIPISKDYNLIDPSLFQEQSDSATDSYLTFGSYWGGIYQYKMDAGQLDGYNGEPLTNLARNSTPNAAVVEGAITFQWKNYYYLFFSSGQCCVAPPGLPPPGDEYRVNVCRSSSITGPYVDATGKDCASANGGSTVLASHGANVYAPGGQGVMLDEASGRTVMYYHYINPNIGYEASDFQFGFNYLDFDTTGWPTVVTY